MTMQPSSTIFKVKRPDGSIWDIPEQNLDKALSLGGEVVEDQSPSPLMQQSNEQAIQQPQQAEKMFKVKRPDGSMWDIPEANLERAKQLGGQVVDQGFDPEYDGFLKTAARTAKTIGSEIVGTIPDLATSIYNIPASIQNATKASMEKIDPNYMGENDFIPVSQQQDLPLIPSVAGAVDSAIDEATNDYTKTQEGDSLQAGLKIASAVATPGGLAKAAAKSGQKATSKVLGALGTTNPTGLAAAGATGVGSSEASKAGYGTAASIGLGLAAGAGVGSAAKALNPNNLARKATSIAGFGKKNLNVDAIEAANRLNIDLPGVAATEAVAPSFAHSTLSKFPYFGEELRQKIQTASKQFQKSWEDMMDIVGPAKTEEVSLANSRNYKLMRKSVPNDAAVDSSPILEAISNIENKLETITYSDPSKKLFSIMEDFKKTLSPSKPKLPMEFEKYSPQIKEQILNALPNEAVEISVNKLIRQKVELNKIMRDRNIFDRTDTDSLSFLKDLSTGVDTALENYGATNPTFLKNLKNANEQFAKTAKRESLDDVLSGKIVNPKTGEVSYNSLLSTLGDRKKQKFLKNNLGEANYKKLNDFVVVAKSMESAIRRNPNPSGSATVGSVMGLIASVAYGNFSLPAAVVGGGKVATKLLTNKKFLNKTLQFSKEPKETVAKQLEKIVEESTGMTIQTLQKYIVDQAKEQ